MSTNEKKNGIIGEKLKNLRERKGLPMSAISSKLGISLGAYQKYENNTRDVSTKLLKEFADFYGVTTDYLLGREPKADPYLDLNLKKADEDEMLKKYMSLPENVRALLLKLMKEILEGKWK